MGNCLSVCFLKQSETTESNRNTETTQSVNSGAKSLPLKREKIKWKSTIPMDKNTLMSKREEFWHTSPAFEGRQEIWDALKAAVEAIESDDYELAQAIIIGANIILPRGILSECFDELGNSYKLPAYVLSDPLNLILSPSNPNESHNLVVGDQPSTSFSDPNVSHLKGTPLKIFIRFRLSSGEDYQESVCLDDTVGRAKEQLSETFGSSPSQQKWFCYGKPLHDSALIKDCQIPAGFIVQVVIQKVAIPQMTSVE